LKSRVDWYVSVFKFLQGAIIEGGILQANLTIFGDCAMCYSTLIFNDGIVFFFL